MENQNMKGKEVLQTTVVRRKSLYLLGDITKEK
jgi:hypothetical protein